MAQFSRIWVVGAGAIGSALAALLTSSARVPVALVGRRAHWRALRARGLRIESSGSGGEAPLRLETRAPEEVPPLSAGDLVLLAGKWTDLAATIGWLRSRLAASTALLALQNGLRVDAWLERELGRPVDRGLVYFGAHVPSPGRLRFYPGLLRLRASPAAEFLAGTLAGSALRCEILPDLRRAEWEKLAINCLANPLAAILSVRNAEIARSSLDPLKTALLDEVRSVAAAEGIELALTVAAFNDYISGPTGENIPSMAMDVRRGEATEIAQLNGAVVGLGRSHRIATPVNATLVQLIEALERRDHSAGLVGSTARPSDPHGGAGGK